MFKLTQFFTIAADATAADREAVSAALKAAGQAPHVLRARLEPTLAGSHNGGDFTWHVHFSGEGAYRTGLQTPAWREVQRLSDTDIVAHIDGVTYAPESTGIAEPDLKDGIHRTLLLAVRPGISTAKIAQFEAEMREMARYVPVIRNWGFSRTAETRGARAWSHVWEQDFQDVGGLRGAYMLHPIHFGHVDRWFDPESHDWIVDLNLCHTFCATAQSMIAISA